ncbi:MAG TPA: GNAT family N-acetyltransferase [Pyrinomonadaceae bacterium]|nr:GNAT family N-acetyltransferase [Pyrinomonadaceae bacterium]
MPELRRYDGADEIPRELERHVRSLLQAEWPATGDETAGPLVEPEWHPTHFILADGHKVWSYARTIWARVTHLGRGWKLYGLGDVVTAPGLRGAWYGSRVVRDATAHIRSDYEADAAVLLTEPGLEAFYRRYGWEATPELEVRTDEYDEHQCGGSLPMMLFLSESAGRMRPGFHASPLVLPGDEW